MKLEHTRIAESSTSIDAGWQRPAEHSSRVALAIALACFITLIPVREAAAQGQEIGVLGWNGTRLTDVARLREGDSVRPMSLNPDAEAWIYRAGTRVAGSGNFDGVAGDDLILRSRSEIALVSHVGSSWVLLMSSDLPMRFGDWQFDLSAKLEGIGDFDGPGTRGVATDDILITTPAGLGILTLASGRAESITFVPTGTRLGAWSYQADHEIRGIGDFDGDGRDDILISSDWGIGILAVSRNELHTRPELASLVVAADGSWLGEWNYQSSHTIQGIGDFDRDGRDDILIKSDWGVGVLTLFDSVDREPQLTTIAIARGGTELGHWMLDSSDTIQGIGNLDNAGGDDILITSLDSLGVLTLGAGGLTSLMKQGWTFDAGKLIPAVADFDGDDKDDLVRRTDWDFGLMTFDQARDSNRLSWLDNANYCHSFGRWKVGSRDRVVAVGDFDDRPGAEMVLVRGWWTEQGPQRIVNAEDVHGMVSQQNPAIGAVTAIAAHPRDADIVYVGTAGGGVWKTENATAPDPAWIPLTDDQPTLSIGSLAFDPLTCNERVPTCLTLYAGTGSFTNSGQEISQQAQGLLRTTDGGRSWTILGKDEFAGKRIHAVVPTTLTQPAAALGGGDRQQVTPLQTILVAAFDGGGLWRSNDGGSRWISSGSPAGSAIDLVADPGNPRRFFASLRSQGVFRSDNGGGRWTPVLTSSQVVAASWIDLAIQRDPTTGRTIVYVATLRQGTLQAVFYSAETAADPPGASWIQVTRPSPMPLRQDPRGVTRSLVGDTQFSLLADPDRPFAFFVRGKGCAYRVDASANPPKWSLIIDHEGAQLCVAPVGDTFTQRQGGNRPMNDSRVMVFDAGGRILEGDDGGIYRLEKPRHATDWRWHSVNGNLGITEFLSASYDSLNNIVFGSSWDNGGVMQKDPSGGTWTQIFGADAGFSAVENDLERGVSYRYWQGNNHRSYWRLKVDRLRGELERTRLTFGGLTDSPGSVLTGRSPGQPAQPGLAIAVNAVDPARILFGGNSLFLSTDRGDSLGPAISIPGLRGRVTAIGFGSAGNPWAALLGTNAGQLWFVERGGAGERVPLQAGQFVQSTVDLDGDGNRDAIGPIQDVVLDPSDSQVAYVATKRKVLRTADAGANWVDITGNLPRRTLEFGTELRAIAAAPAGSRSRTVWVGGLGGVFSVLDSLDSSSSTVTWLPFGSGLPNALVTDLDYDPTDRLLIAGTLGRGAWTIAAPCPGER